MNSAEGVPCSLLTGQEKHPTPGARHVSCTMEMVDVSAPVAVGVLDEIQMISDEERGWAWTRALMGLPAAEVHVCGDISALPLLRSIVDSMGEDLEVRQYERLSPLQLQPKLLQSWRQVEAGDCVVAFSRKKLFEIKQDIERSTSLRCAMVYGALPPAVRRDQARAFNDPEHETSVLVATDAVGMGLNLAIRRVVFSAVTKFDGVQSRALTVSEAKQIAGRAGRFSSEHPTGFVAARTASDRALLRDALAGVSVENTTAGLSPSSDQLELFAASIATPDQRRRLVVERADRELGRAWRNFEHAQWERTQAQSYAHGAEHVPEHLLDSVGSEESGPASPCSPRQHFAANMAAALLQRVADNLGAAAVKAGAAPQLAEQYRQRLGVLQRGAEALPPPAQAAAAVDSSASNPAAGEGGGFVSLFAGLHGGQGDFAAGLAEAQLRTLVADRGAWQGGYAAHSGSDNDSDSDDSSDEDGVGGAFASHGGASAGGKAALFLRGHGGSPAARGAAEYAGQFEDEREGDLGDGDNSCTDGEVLEAEAAATADGEAPSAAAAAMSDAASTLAQQLENITAAHQALPGSEVGDADFGAEVPKARTITFSQLLALYLDFAKVDEARFFMCDHADATRVAAAIDHVPLPLAARFIFCRAPVDVDDKVAVTALQRYAKRFAADEPVPIALRVPDRPPQNTWELKALEGAHGVFDMYLWLCQRFPQHFVQQRKAERAVASIEGMIQHALVHLGAEGRAALKSARAKRVQGGGTAQDGAGALRSSQPAVLTEDLVQRVRAALEDANGEPSEQVKLLKDVRRELQETLQNAQHSRAHHMPGDAPRGTARDARRAHERQIDVLRQALKRTKKALKVARSAC